MVVQDQELTTQNSRSLIDVSNPVDEDSTPNEIGAVSSSSRGRRRSEIWRHYEKKIVGGIWKSECNHCHKLLGGNSKHGTSHLHEHLKRCPVFAGDVVIQDYDLPEQELPTQDSRSLISVSNPVEEESPRDEIVPFASSYPQDGRRSDVWRHYVKKLVSGMWKSECNYCHKHLSGNPKHGTKHLHDHVKRCPVLLRGGVRKQVITRKVMKVYRSSSQDEGRSRHPFNHDDGRRALVNMIIMHEYPLNIVEHAGFRNYSNVLQPLFKCPSRNSIRNDIMEIYNVEKRKVNELLKKLDSRVAITFDLWTTDDKKRDYMAISGYYIDASWSLQSQMLRHVYVPCPHTEEALCEVLINCLVDWGINTKLSTITLENASANNTMYELVREKLNSDSMLLLGRFLYMHCLAHILNLMVKDGLEVILDELEKIRGCMAYWTATPEREEKFEESAKQLKIPFSRKLNLDCPTKWTSTYEMLETVLMYRDVFCWLRQYDLQYKMLSSDTDWKFCAEVCEKLKLLYSVTELFAGTRHPTANLCFPHVCQIRIALNCWHGSSNEVISNMAKNMRGKFDQYWDGIYVIMGVLTVLDPRFKIKLIEYYFPAIYGDKAPFHIKKVRDVCYDLLNEYWGRYNKIQEEYDNDTSVSNQVECFKSQELDNDMFGYDAFVKKQKKKDTSFLKTELDKYLDDDVLPRTSDFDIFLWWKINGNTYPLLKAIAKDLLAIQVSTMPSKLAFSTNVRVIDRHLSSLHPETVEALLCTRSWLEDAQKRDGAISGSNNGCTVHDDTMDIEPED